MHCRAMIEIMFGRLKDWRRVATRYDRCPKVFLSVIAARFRVSIRFVNVMVKLKRETGRLEPKP